MICKGIDLGSVCLGFRGYMGRVYLVVFKVIERFYGDGFERRFSAVFEGYYLLFSFL